MIISDCRPHALSRASHGAPCFRLALQDDELDEAEISGFDAAAQTLYCGNTLHDQLVQVGKTKRCFLVAPSCQLLGRGRALGQVLGL